MVILSGERSAWSKDLLLPTLLHKIIRFSPKDTTP